MTARRLELVPFSEFPYKGLPATEREQSFPVGEQIRQKGLQLLLGTQEVSYHFDGFHLYLMGGRACDQTGFRGAELLVEKWHPSPTGGSVRDFSYAFYPGRVFSRPNASILMRSGAGEITELVAGCQACYEPDAAELTSLIELMNGCDGRFPVFGDFFAFGGHRAVEESDH